MYCRTILAWIYSSLTISLLYFSLVLGFSDTDDDEDTSTVNVQYPEFSAGSTQEPFYTSSPSLESSTSREVDRIDIETFIDTDMETEVRLLDRFRGIATDSDTIKALNRLPLQPKPAQSAKRWQLVIFSILHLFDSCTNMLSLTVLLKITVMLDPSILLSDLVTFSDTIYKCNVLFAVSNLNVNLSLFLSLSLFLVFWISDRKAPGHCWSHQLTECCTRCWPTAWGSHRKSLPEDRSAGRYVENVAEIAWALFVIFSFIYKNI